MRKSRLLLLPFSTLFILLSGCGDIVPIWTEQVNLSGDYTLYRNVACEFEIQFEHPQPELDVRLELEVVYDVSSIGQASLPLAIFVERKDSVSKSFPNEYSLSVPLKEDGKWLGQASGNQVDNSLTFTAIPSVTLKSNTPYVLKIYANESDAIYGIVRIAARIYENVPPEEAE